jgi:methylenetetrahydrofolate dehydrogenase (NADP+)/methenyltetrahydrofolate cyclohydrolase
MLIDGKKIASILQKELKKSFKKLKNRKKIKLVVFLVGNSPDQLSFVRIKKKVAKQLKVKFEFVHIKSIPSFESLINQIKTKSFAKETTGVIIQQPLPAQLQTNSIYDFIPIEKEIEGHRNKTPYTQPLGFAILTILKYIYKQPESKKDLFIDLSDDSFWLRKKLKGKKIILVGRGITGGRPIGTTLSSAKINYFSIHSQTPNPENYYLSADIIITAVGKKHLRPEFLKPGVVLINVGLRKENGRLKGDYEEKEIKDIAGFYTPTPGGIGPIDVVYLYKNLLEAAKLQK